MFDLLQTVCDGNSVYTSVQVCTPGGDAEKSHMFLGVQIKNTFILLLKCTFKVKCKSKCSEKALCRTKLASTNNDKTTEIVLLVVPYLKCNFTFNVR